MENIYDMELHEKIYNDDCDFTILRVAGGWIYSHWSNGIPHPVFVPYNNEFIGIFNKE